MAKACHVELFAKIYRIEVNQMFTTKDIIHKTECDEGISIKISQLVSSTNGVLTAAFLEKELQNANVEISPRKISLFDLNTTLDNQLNPNTNLHFLNTQSLNQLSTISLLEGETAKAVCDSCNTLGEKNIKLNIINPISNSTRTLWFTSKLFAQVKVMKAKKNLSFQDRNLSAEDLYEEETFTTNTNNTLTNLENIRFFKPNKNIIEGSIITNMDLQPVNLVNYGTPVKATLKNQNISLSKNAIPSRSAQFGDIIEVQTINSNKKVLARVIDYNKVVIEL